MSESINTYFFQSWDQSIEGCGSPTASMVMSRQPHVVVVPFPAQGHVTPLLKLSHKIADYGIKVTFVNTEFIHGKVVAAMSPEKKDEEEQQRIRLVSIPDGLGPEDDRKDTHKLIQSIRSVMPGHLKELIDHSSENDEQISCLIADANLGWILEVAKEIGIEQAAVWPAGPGILVSLFQTLALEQGEGSNMNAKDNIIEEEDDYIRSSDRNEVRPSKEIPAQRSEVADPMIQKIIFELAQTIKNTVEVCNWVLCNAFYELDSLACDLIPNLLPVGPLLASDHLSHSTGSFRIEDSSCLSWLNEQPAGSVVYVSFGSTGVFSQLQFEELALGLELAGRPFLWIVRSDLTIGSSVAEYPDGFKEKVAGWGKIVEWAPQEKVLAHPSVACFFTHCGWNSTMEGLSMGVPLLCWPYFGDQFHNQDYICDVWKVGLSLKPRPDENKIISRHEIKVKIEELVSDEDIKANVLKLEEVARRSVKQGGSSCKNLESFIRHLKH